MQNKPNFLEDITSKELIFCDNKECKERGEHLKCYLDSCYKCDFYKKKENEER